MKWAKEPHQRDPLGSGGECRREHGGLWEQETGLDGAVLTVRREEALGPREANPTRVRRREKGRSQHHGRGGGRPVYSPQGLRYRGVGRYGAHTYLRLPGPQARNEPMNSMLTCWEGQGFVQTWGCRAELGGLSNCRLAESGMAWR